MAFRESPSFPDFLTFGSHGGPSYRTHVVATKAGVEQRNQAWSQSLAVYEVGLVHRDATATNALRRFFRAIAMGRRHGFRFTDRLPGESTGVREVLGTGDGVEDTFQLVKHYTLGGYDSIRTITKPVAGSVVVYLNGTATTAFTVDPTTGLVTLTSPPAGGVVVSASCQFQVPVRFETDTLDLVAVEPGIFSWPSIKLSETRAIV